MREYWELEEEVLDRFLLRAHFGRGYGAELRHSVNKTCSVACGLCAEIEKSHT
jgi:hypothetical protein